MNLFQRWIKNLYLYGLEYFDLYYSTYRGVCVDNKDPDEQGKIKVKVPLLLGNETFPTWAWPKASWAGENCGSFVIPDIGDPVYVCFEGGKKELPIYEGGWWPKPDGQESFAKGFNAYVNGIPHRRSFKTKAGHEIVIDDTPDKQGIKVVWHEPNKDLYSFFAFTSDGSVSMSNHKGCYIDLRATDNDERVIVSDASGNMYTMDKDGVKIADMFGNAISTSKDSIQFLAAKNVVINTPAVNIKAGGVEIGDLATDSAVKGTTFMKWWTTVFKIWLDTHTHPTGVGPSGPPIVPHVAPVEKMVLTDKLKMQ